MQTKLKNLFKFSTPELPLQSLPEFKSYLCFINRLEITVKLTQVVAVVPHRSQSIAGWQGLHSLTCLGEDRQLYDIDIRYAWGSEIFKQNLVDHGWSEATLLHKKNKQEPTRHKLIIYLCEDSTNLDTNQKIEPVPDRFLIGVYWQSIHHIYLLLPVEHPFDIPDIDVKTRIAGYSTTRCLTKNQPKINPDSQIASYLFLPANSERTGEGGLRTKGLWKQSTPEQTLISVITVVFNGAKYIDQTIQSVINQLYDNVEYIIIDGGSTDGTKEIIRKYEEYINYWVSEEDEGIYDAMNKGIDLATGDWINFMNAGDYFFDSKTLNSIFDQYNFDGVDIIFGNHEVRYYNHKKVKHCGQINNIWKGSQFSHQSAFILSTLHKKNIFNTENKIAADFEFFYKAFQGEKKFKKIDVVVSSILAGGLSDRKRLDSILNRWKVIKKNKISNFYYASIFTIEIAKILIKKLYRMDQNGKKWY